MKKSISFIAAIAMAATMATAIPASATDTSSAGTNDITLQYTVDEGYTVTIPAESITLSKEGTELNISAKDVIIHDGSTLEVAVSSENYSETDGWQMIDKASATNILGYSIKNGEDDVASTDVVFSVDAGAAVVPVTLTATPDAATKAGTYEDKLTFTVSVDSPATEQAAEE